MSNRLLRAATLAYLALLILAIWPFESTPVLGPLQGVLWRSFERAGLYPGQAIFKNSIHDAKLASHCHVVEGEGSDGTTRILWQPECPPVGFQLGTDYGDVVLQRITRSAPVADLMRMVPRRARQPISVRRFAAIGDFFCHSPLVEGGPFERVTLRQRRNLRSYASGAWLVRPELVCRFDCAPGRVPLPRCDFPELPEGSPGRSRSPGEPPG
ncbi:MAG: hypothetical protein O7G30_06770 [Proteobacteria bacterium]|nr:hypothetical protein [Pseudomonadota bacterium]